MIRIAHLLWTLSLGSHVFLASASADERFSIQSPDGRTQVEFNAAGRVVSLKGVPLGAGKSGLFVDDPATRTTYYIGAAGTARFEKLNGGLKESS
jgi:hypothetical protein